KCAILLSVGLRNSVASGTPIYPVIKELVGDNISDIKFDSQSRAWIGVRGEQIHDYGFQNIQYSDGGLSMYDGTRWKTIQQTIPDGNVPPNIKGNSVTSLLLRGGTCDTTQKVWVGMASFFDNVGWGIDILNPSANTVVSMDNTLMP